MFLVAKAGSFLVVMGFVAGPRIASSIHVRNATGLLDPGHDAGSLVALQPQSRIAILLRGAAFRPGGGRGGVSGAGSCNESHISDQLQVTQSLMDMVVLPLERASHTVDMYLVESTNCSSLLGLIAGVLGEARVRFQGSFRSSSQRDGVRGALESFYRHTPQSYAAEPGQYDVVIVSRFDLVFKTYINEWPNVNFRAFNFFSRCALGGWKHRHCVNDILWVMPGTYVPKFKSLIGHDGCYRRDSDAGHWCYNKVAKSFGVENVGFITDWTPVWRVREPNRWADLF